MRANLHQAQREVEWARGQYQLAEQLVSQQERRVADEAARSQRIASWVTTIGLQPTDPSLPPQADATPRPSPSSSFHSFLPGPYGPRFM